METDKVTLIIDNVFTEIRNADKDLEHKIWDILSFEKKEFSAAPIQYPMIRHLFNRKTKLTYTGLLPYVLDIFKAENIEYEIIDSRIAHEKNADFKLIEYFDENTPLKLRDYQEMIVNACNPREIIQATTGSGKTLMMAAIIAKFNVKPVAVFADKLSLCLQLQSEFHKFLNEDIGIVGGGLNERKDITVYSVQSTTQDMVKDAKMILVDECFVYDTEIQLTNNKTMKIGEMVDMYDPINPYRVVTYNHETQEKEIKPVINAYRIPVEKQLKAVLIKVNEELIKLIATEDHKFFTIEEEYVQAKKLQEGQTVILNDGKLGKIFKVVNVAHKEKYVYDIEVEDNHNFFANRVLVHNCHHLACESLVSISKWCENAYYRIAVSATPWRDDNSDLLIDAAVTKKDETKKVTASDLIRKGYLVPCNIYWVKQKQVVKGTSNYNKLYAMAIINNAERNMNIVKIAYQMRKYKDATILILIQRVEHGQKLLSMLQEYLPCSSFTVKVKNRKTNKETLVSCKEIEFLSGQDDTMKRDAVISAAKEKKCKILIASTIADEGLDLPSLDTLILAGAGKSSTRAMQRIGRVLRLFIDKKTGKKKEKATVFDFCDYTKIFRRQARCRDKMYRAEEEFQISEMPEKLLEMDIPKLKK